LATGGDAASRFREQLFTCAAQFILLDDPMTYLFTDWDEEQAQQQIEKTAKQRIRLRPYQLEAGDAVYEEWRTVRSTMVNIPTGGGKSVVFAEVMRRWDVSTQGKILLIAHRRELILQAIGHAKRAGLSSGIEMAGKHASGEEDVIVASVQTLIATRKCRVCFGEGCDECFDGKVKRFTRFNPRDVGMLVIDESHRAVAKSYRAVMKWFEQNPLQKTLMVTATPRRADKVGLHNVCQSIAYQMELRQAIDEGWLVPIRQKFVTVEGLDISKVEVRAGKLNEGQVEAAFLGTDEDEERLLHSIVKPTIDEARGRKTLVFAAGKDHAHKLGACFAAHGIEAGVVVDDTDLAERAELINRYSNGDLQVLVNCLCLSEGFDAPATAVIANCRPTKSESLYLQILGRSTRPLPGVVDGPETAEDRKAAIAASDKPFAVLLDFVGNSGDIKLVSVADVLAGDRIEPIDLQEALRIATKSGETVDIEELAEKVKQSRLEAAEKKETERRQRLLTKTKADRADYSTVDVDLFGGPTFESDGKYVEPITKGQQGFLYHQLGMKRKDTKNLSKKQASGIIGKVFKQAGDDWKRLIKEAGSVSELQQVAKAISARKSSDYLMRDERLVESLRAAYRARKKELGGE
jgi:superfamily II DNA or RNA helicase